MTDEPDQPTIRVEGDVSGQIGLGGSVSQSQESEGSGSDADSVTVLFWAANPIDTTPLRLGEEVRTIDERLRGSTHADRFELEQQWAVRYTDLSDGLMRYSPDIVHFSGHGDSDGRLMLEDAQGSSHAVDADALAELFRIAGDTVQCVVFNACYSLDQAEAVSEHINCVVGTTRAIADAAALAFAGGFYRALGYGRTVQSAFDLGCNEIDLVGLADHDVPQLHTKRGVDATDMRVT